MNFKRINKYAAASTLIPMAVIVAVVFVVYFGTATRWTFHPPWTIDYVNPMASALVRGRLDIPDPAMTYDLAQYRGRWYMTWGALAALVHIPLQLLAGGRYVPALYTSLLFGSFTVTLLWWILERVRRDWFPGASVWQPVVFAFLYAFGTTQYYLSTVGSIWQVNQVVSTFFGVLGTAMILKKNRSVRDYVMSSAWYGVALLGRPTVGLLIIIPVCLVIYELWQKKSGDIVWKKGIAIFVPICAAVFVVFGYNAVRFGNPFETGHQYLAEAPDLAAKRERFGMLSFSYIPTNVWHMIILPPRLSWVHGPTMNIDLMGNSIFFLSPILLSALGTWFWMRSRRPYLPIIVAVWSGIFATAASSLLYYNTGWVQFGYRYALDFSFLLVVLVYFWMSGKLRSWMAPLVIYTLWVNYTGIRLLQ